MLSALSNHYITSLPARSLCSRFALSSQCDGFLVTLTSGHHRPGHAGKFVGECNRRHLGRSPFEQLGKPRPMLAAMDFCVSDHRQCTSEEERAQVSIALLCDIAKLLPTAARMLLRHQSDPGREVAPGSKHLGIGDAGDQRGCQCRTDPRQIVQPPAGLARAMPNLIRRSNSRICAFSPCS